MRLIVFFTETPLPELSAAGGKGLSLIRMAQAGLAVPPGFVLTSAFFAGWMQQLRAAPEWAAFAAASRAGQAELKSACDALKARCGGLALDDGQRAELSRALDALGASCLFAVRSSSPEEDLEGSSFAGGYETVLGVGRSGIEAAVRRAFASCLDARVAIYKREHGFDPGAPRIAVVVQQQIASEVAGVALSLNPITNAYDEAIVDANWGLGESVVAGQASPDHFVIDKLARRVLERRLGKKETSTWLLSDGGTQERPDPRHDQLSLSDEQLLALAEQLVRIEALYGTPMDIEWAFAGGALYLLQARPMTAFVELPADMVTAPGEPKRLYVDFTIAIQGLLRPLSPMGTSALAVFFGGLSRFVLGEDLIRTPRSAVRVQTGRIWLNICKMLALIGKERVLRVLGTVDPLTQQAVATVDPSQYPASRLPPWRILPRAPGILWRILRATLWPAAWREKLDRAVAEHLEWMKELEQKRLPAPALAREIALRTVPILFRVFIPGLATWRISIARLLGMFPGEEHRRLVLKLEQSLPGNVTVEMGLALAELARKVPPGSASEALPPEAARAFEGFLERYGHRGPGELDVATPRYRERPGLLVDQLRQLAQVSDPEKLPDAMYQRSRRDRLDAVESLAKVARGRGAERKLRALAARVERLGGIRETPKFVLIKGFELVRSRLLEHGAELAKAGRLDRPEQIFDLELADLDDGLADPKVDLRARAALRRRPVDRLASVKELPRVIDSRGRIYRAPPPPRRDGELVGLPVSVGTVRGKVKVLHTADEKPLLPGEVLVARATDPGWTPLFVNACAVVLEVGGVLQHGALVAREYGKPCVTGVEDATAQLHDGELVEVDGTSGIIRLLRQGGA